ncbi:2-oxoacid:acceptor oxidoreductase family protein [Elusimicrobiota bacterium]
MQEEIIISGFGGQGVLFGGMLLAQTALEENKKTTWFPSYGAEMRGGTANSTVIISDHNIGSPIVTYPSVLLCMNQVSLERFLPKTNPDSIVIINSSLVKSSPKSGSKLYSIPATEIADKELKDVRVANVVMAGYYIKISSIAKLESAKNACKTILATKKNMVDLNIKALELGFNYSK